MSRVWFSAMLRFVVLIDGTPERLARSVIVVQAEDFPDAFRRVIEVGRSMGSRYMGGEGNDVEWRFKHVETLDMLGDAITDGREIWAEPAEIPAGFAEEAALPASPETSKPTPSGV